MNIGQTVFSQLMEFIPTYQFQTCVDRYQGERYVKDFSCWDQFLCLAFAQLTYREGLRDIVACLRAQQPRLYHMGFRGHIARSTLAYANRHRDWRIFADFTQGLIATARDLYQHEPLGLDLAETVYAFDSTTIDLCLTLFPWAQFRRHKSAVKIHALLDLRGSIPTSVYVTGGQVHDVNLLDEVLLEPGAFYLLDRGYVDFARLHLFTQAYAFVVTRAKKNLQFCLRTSRPVERSSAGLRLRKTSSEVCRQSSELRARENRSEPERQRLKRMAAVVDERPAIRKLHPPAPAHGQGRKTIVGENKPPHQ